MSGAIITCSLCGTAMPASERYCPRCKSLNVHYAFYNDPISEAGTTPDAAPYESEQQAGNGASTQQAVDSKEAPSPAFADLLASSPVGEAGEITGQAAKTAQASGGDIETPKREPSRPARHKEAEGEVSPSLEVWKRRLEVDARTARVRQAQERPAQGAGIEFPQNWRGSPRPARVYRGDLKSREDGEPTRPDPNLAFYLELLGYAGILGVGHMYGGRVVRGVVLLLVWWVVIIAVITQMPACNSCLLGLIMLGAPITSGQWIRYELVMEQTQGTATREERTL